MNLFLRAKIREGVVRSLGDSYDVGPFSFNVVTVDRARFLIAFGQPVYMVGLCTQKMAMTTQTKPAILCIGEATGVDIGKIMQSITVKYDESSFLILLVDYILSKNKISGADTAAIHSLSLSSARAISTKYSFKKITSDDGWLFVERSERDRMALQAIQYLDTELGNDKWSSIKKTVVEKCKLLHGRANSLSVDCNLALRELIDKYE